jgi:hypothetical protein
MTSTDAVGIRDSSANKSPSAFVMWWRVGRIRSGIPRTYIPVYIFSYIIIYSNVLESWEDTIWDSPYIYTYIHIRYDLGFPVHTWSVGRIPRTYVPIYI